MTKRAEYEATLSAFMARFGLEDRDQILLALSHKSYAHEKKTPGKHNERLEFLGDAVLDLVIAEALMKAHPEATEGDLTRLRSGMVNERSFGEAGRALGLGELMRLGKGERQDKGHHKDSLLSDAFEAVMAALFLERGLGVVREVVEAQFGPRIHEARIFERDVDYKSRLQERVQRRFHHGPQYLLVGEEGPEHEKVFIAEVWFDHACQATARGRSKKAAERAAAQLALEAWEGP